MNVHRATSLSWACLVAAVACSDSPTFTPLTVDAAITIDAETDAAVDADIDAADTDAADLDGPGADDASIDAPLIRMYPYGFVVDNLRIATSVNEATMLGVDVDEVSFDTAFGGIDNSLGNALANFSGQGLDVSATGPIDRGDVILLVDVESDRGLEGIDDPVNVWVGGGGSPQPAPCASATDPICRRHLDGRGSFVVELNNQVTSGRLLVGTVTASLGDIVVPMVLGGERIFLPLTKAKIELRAFDREPRRFGSGSKLGGAIRQRDVEQLVYPGWQRRFNADIDRDCPAPRSAPDCNCATGSTGATLASIMDVETPRDCTTSLRELTAFMNPLIQKDIDSDGDGVRDAVSLGVGITGIAANYSH